MKDQQEKILELVDDNKRLSKRYQKLLKKSTVIEKTYQDNLNSASYKLSHLLLHDTQSFRALITLAKRILNKGFK